MRQTLNISGINRNFEVTKSDNPSCLEAVNIRFKDGKWVNSNRKQQTTTLARSYDEIFIHTIDTIKNWIGWSNTTNNIYWFNGSTETVLHTGDYTSVKFQSSGNILTVYAKTSTDVKVFYSLFDRTANSYGPFVDFEIDVFNVQFFTQAQKYPYIFAHRVVVGGIERVNMIGLNIRRESVASFIDLYYFTNNQEQVLTVLGSDDVALAFPPQFYFERAKFTSDATTLILSIIHHWDVTEGFDMTLNILNIFKATYNPSTDKYYSLKTLDSSVQNNTLKLAVSEISENPVTYSDKVFDEKEISVILNDTDGDGDSDNIDVSAGTTIQEKYEIVNAAYLRDKNKAQKIGFFEGFTYVTYAFRLYDGSYVKYSFPELVYVGEDGMDLSVFGKIISNSVNVSGFKFKTLGMFIKTPLSEINDFIAKYNKYILSMDFFITPPVSRFNFTNFDTFVQQGIQVKELNSQANFYKIYSIPLKDLGKYVSDIQPINGGTFLNSRAVREQRSTTSTDTYKMDNFNVYINQYTDLNNITGFEALPVDNYTAHVRHSDIIFKYNSRLMIANTIQKLFKGFSPQWFTGLTDASEGSTTMNCFFVVKLETDNGIKYVRSDSVRIGAIFSMTMPDFFGYPDSRATELKIVLQDLSDDNYRVWKKIELTKHLTHNFSYYLSPTLYQQYILELESNNIFEIKKKISTDTDDTNWSTFWDTAEEFTGLPTGSTSIKDTNKISITEVNNPIVFPAKYTYNVGDSEIIGIASNADPISSGQFGQYPIIVFTKTGLWTLNISESDKIYISNITPLNGEVCTNKDSITNISGSIFFISNDDIKMLKGPEILIISDIMNGRYESKAKNNTFYGQIINSDKLFGIPTSLSSDSFKNYLAGAKFAYDKDHDEFIVSNSDKPYSYVFNTKYKIWYKIEQSFDKIVQDYPEYYGVDGLDVYDLALEDAAQSKIFIETQAIEFSPDGLSKLLRLKADIKCLGLTEPINGSSNLGFYILGSMDGEKWSLINGKEMAGEVSYIELQRTHVSVKYIKLIIASVISSLEMTGMICDVEIGFKDKIK